MTTFDTRDKAFENKYAHDEEMAFKVRARAHKLLGLWAASLMSMSEKDAEAYAHELVQTELAIDSTHLIEQLQSDFAEANVEITTKEIRIAIQHQAAIAAEQILGGKK